MALLLSLAELFAALNWTTALVVNAPVKKRVRSACMLNPPWLEGVKVKLGFDGVTS
jgi:hypothetical protein